MGVKFPKKLLLPQILNFPGNSPHKITFGIFDVWDFSKIPNSP